MKSAAFVLSSVVLVNGCISIATHEEQMKRCRDVAAHAQQLEHDLTETKSKNSELESTLAKQKAEHEALESKLTEVRGTYDQLIQELKDDIASGQIQINQTAQGLMITLDNQILFQSGSSQLQKQGRRVLVQIANAIRNVQDHNIEVQGHTDNIRIAGPLKERFPSNWDLSAARAASVLRFLEESGKIDPSRLILEAFADQRPIADNRTAEGRHRNRRVDIILVAKDQ